MSYLRTIRRSSPLLLSAIGVQALLLLSGVLSARGLGVEGRGAVVLGMLVPALVAFASGLGTGNLVNLLVASSGRIEDIYKIAVKATRLSSLVGALVAAGIVEFALDDYSMAILGGCSAYALVRLSQVTGAFQGSRKYWLAFCLDISVPLIYSSSLLFVYLAGPKMTPTLVVGLWTIAMYLIWTASTYVLKSLTKHSIVTVHDETLIDVKAMRRRGVKSLVATYSPLESFRIDQIAVASLAGTLQLGLYSVAIAFANLPKLLGQAAAVRVAQVNPDTWVKRKLLLIAILLVVAASAVATALLTPLLLPLLFGSEFADAVSVAVILSLVGGMMGVRKILTELMRSREIEGKGSLAEGAAVLVFLVIIAVGPWRTSALGISLSLLGASMLSVLFMFIIYLKDLRRPRPRQATF